MLKKFNSSNDLSINLAKYTVKEIQKKNSTVLGCPSGRSLRKTYKHIGILSYKMNVDLSNVKIVMMDEFVILKNEKFQICNPKLHYSCVGYSYRVIQRLLNYQKSKKKKLTKSNIFFPEIYAPEKYDKLIQQLGGIDIFFLASGSSDGHVAFNNYTSNVNSPTHIVALSTQTRKDNLKTFSKFQSLKEVPKFGITVGLGTIHKLSKKAILVLSGKEKRKAADMILSKKLFDKQWPASIIYKCKKKLIYIDKDALGTKTRI
jgi:glucosamine-6-phosphate deaminase